MDLTRIQNEIEIFERRFLIKNKDGLCVDWMEASKSKDEFISYIRNRQNLRSLLLVRGKVI